MALQARDRGGGERAHRFPRLNGATDVKNADIVAVRPPIIRRDLAAPHQLIDLQIVVYNDQILETPPDAHPALPPGHSFSTSDVFDGLLTGLTAAGADVVTFRWDQIMQRLGAFVPAPPQPAWCGPTSRSGRTTSWRGWPPPTP